MSSLQIGIIGLPNVGKSTLFNALTNNSILAANYPFATIEPNTGIVPVPDHRLEQLGQLYQTEKLIPATVTFVDIAGLVAGASKGEGLGNKFLANIRECNALCHVVRAFANNDVLHVANRVEPADDIAIINTELVLADLQTLEHHLPKLEKEAKANPKKRPDVEILRDFWRRLENNQPLWEFPELIQANAELLKELHLLTAKKIIYLFNVDEASLGDATKKQALADIVAPNLALFVCATLEDELRALDAADAAELLASYGQTESGLLQLIRAAYETLNLQSFLTAGPKEVRAWTIKQDSTAPEAAGVIHTDFKRGFIAAQVIDFHDLVEAGSEIAAKAAGKIRTEGKTYIMQPNDVVEFRFNV